MNSSTLTWNGTNPNCKISQDPEYRKIKKIPFLTFIIRLLCFILLTFRLTFIYKQHWTVPMVHLSVWQYHWSEWSIHIHAICPGGTEKSRNFDPSKPVPAGRHFSRKICFVQESLWPVKCTAFSDFWTGQIAINLSRPFLHGRVTPSHVYRIYLTHAQRCGEVFRQSLTTEKGIPIRKQLFDLSTQAQ